MFKTITLVLTNRCNLRCSYCYEEGKALLSLDINKAKEIIDKEIEDYEGYDEFIFDLFGGEPFIEFEMIKEIYSYIDSKDNIKLPWCVFITTNGTKLTPEIKEWLIEHKEKVICGLSMDGIKIVQDHDRSNSYDLLDYKFFAETYPKQGVKMTVSKFGINHLFESVKHLIEVGFNKIDSNLAYGIPWDVNNDGKVLKEQLNLLMNYYLENDIKAECRFLSEPLYLLGQDDGVFRTYCGSKHYLHLYDVDGEEYPCHLFMPSSVKERRKLFDEVDIPKEYMDMSRIDDKCKDCKIRRICHFCFGANYVKNNDIYKIDNEYCEMYKIVFRANAEFQMQLWNRGKIEFDDDIQEKAWIIGVQKVLEETK